MSLLGNTTLAFSEEQAMLLDVAREFCREHSGIAAVRALLPSASGYSDEVWQQMVELGWSGMLLPESAGGAGLEPGDLVPVVEMMGRHLLGAPLISTSLAAQALRHMAQLPTVQPALRGVANGAVATVALLENEDWGDPLRQCQLLPSGELQGRKRLVMDARQAQWFVLDLQAGEKTEGPCALALVHRDALAEGALQAHDVVDETRRAASVDFSGATATAILHGAEAELALRDIQLLGALLVAAEAVGAAAACLDTLVDYLKTRRQFGQLIGSFQALKHPAAHLLCDIENARSLMYHGAAVFRGTAVDTDAEVACRMAKSSACDVLLGVADRAVQFHGGMGFTHDCDAQLYLRRALWAQQQFGDGQHHRRRLAQLLLD